MIKIQKQLITSEDHEWGFGTVTQRRTVNDAIVNKVYTKVSAVVIPAYTADGMESTIQAVLDSSISFESGDLRYAFISGNPSWHFNVKDAEESNHALNLGTFQTLHNVHVDNRNNPHEVTTDQLGLGNVDNTSDMAKPISDATQEALDLRAPIGHAEDTNNPHEIVKSQIGLGNIDNTSDDAKPVSSATQEALDLKYSKSDHIDMSVGSVDAFKPVVTGPNGLLDSSLLDVSSYTPRGSWTPEAGNEYPTEDLNSGDMWIFNDLDTGGYTFTEGTLNGEVAYNGEQLLYASEEWSIIQNSIDLNTVYALDGSRAITDSFAGGGQRFTNAAPGEAASDLIVYSQLSAHTNAEDNPHNVTKAQVGLDQVENIPSTEIVPIGSIIMYSGLVGNIPDNWALCDGNNGTVNLVDKFIRATVTESEIGTTGGSNDAIVVEHSHTGAAHSHTGAAHSHIGAAHTHTAAHNHTASTASAGSHGHGLKVNGSTVAGGSSYPSIHSSGASGTQYIVDAGAHTHSVTVASITPTTSSSGNTATSSAGSEPTSEAGEDETTTVGESGIGQNIPEFIRLAYIQRISNGKR